MKKYSYFLKSGKGTYGKGKTQITVNDLQLNFGESRIYDRALELFENGISVNAIDNRILKDTLFYTRTSYTQELSEDFSNITTSGIYRNPAIISAVEMGMGQFKYRLLVNPDLTSVDFSNCLITLINKSSFLVIGDGSRDLARSEKVEKSSRVDSLIPTFNTSVARFRVTSSSVKVNDLFIVFELKIIDTPREIKNNSADYHIHYQRERVEGTNPGSGEDLTGVISVEENSPNSVTKVWSGTQQQYNTITPKKDDVLYFIVEDESPESAVS